MKISVIVPVYNVSPHLVETLFKSFALLNPNFEIIVIDDFSNQELSNLYEKECQKYNFKYVKNAENKGVSFSRNVGISIASGQYITFVDADDQININLFNSLSNEKLIDDIYLMKYICFSNEESIPAAESENINICASSLHELSQNDLYNIYSLRTVWGKLYKKDLIQKNKFLENLPLSEDTLFSFQALQQAKTISTIRDQIGYYWRLTTGSSSRKYRKNYNEIYQLFYAEAQNTIKNFILRDFIDNDTINIYSITRTCMSFKKFKFKNGISFLKQEYVKSAAENLISKYDKKTATYKICKRILKHKYLGCYLFIIRRRIRQKIFR